MSDTEEETLSDIVLSCVLKTRPTDENEMWEKYQRVCQKKHILPLWGQLRTALGHLYRQGRIRREGAGIRRNGG